ncbi:aminoacyl-tRNA hydrolase [Sulfitobacter delicatus]|mgnify:CR=1 FL=1|uniref:Peptidyl-tRNA hydrolase n=1 Tax=Sulfitobacter delicatus TaxID=218672 RepID=A0A1G7UYB3_9RHOB|nr:aminoacyl-tRNA hydrolase [Sulfitobacter delicatus]SDG51710.1 peptidyl-tRNA hydrolase [Sulfitobacter delicatus]
MKLIVGLGNPGGKYARNRHNIGFMALDRIAEDHGFAPWKGKFQGSVSEGRFGSDRAVLLKPETFMNNSGQSVQAAMKFYKIDPVDVIVFHDELDLAPGKVKCKTGGGHAGHNGLRSIHAHIGADYERVRMGIGHPGHKDAVAGYVLRDFPKADDGWLDDVLRGISDGAADLVRGDTGRFMNAVGLRVSPPRSGTGSKGPKPSEAKKPAAEKPQASPEPEAPTEALSPLQKLMDRFR